MATGTRVPADVRLLATSDDLVVDNGPKKLSGKKVTKTDQDGNYGNILLAGSSIESGNCKAVVFSTGENMAWVRQMRAAGGAAEGAAEIHKKQLMGIQQATGIEIKPNRSGGFGTADTLFVEWKDMIEEVSAETAKIYVDGHHLTVRKAKKAISMISVVICYSFIY